MKYTVIVPIFDERQAITGLHAEIYETMIQLGEPFELLFVDDGSKDGSFEELQKLHPVTIIRFRKNFGQTAALDAGFKHAKGEIVITLDGDGQNDPHDIPTLIKKLSEGYDVVSGWRYNRKDSIMKKFISRGADFLRKLFMNDEIHDSGCTLKAYRRESLESLDLYGEMHRFIPGILSLQGFKISEVKVNHRARTTGTTKYNWKRVIKGFIDMISVWFWRKYAHRPLHLFGGLGFLFGFSGLALGITLTALRILNYISLQDTIWPLVSVFLILAGIQLFVSGLLADIAIKNYYNRATKKLPYAIRNIIEQ